MYKCECGKEFQKANSLNAHFCYCKIHRKGKPIKDKFGKSRNNWKGKTYEEVMGEERAKILKKEISERNKKWHQNIGFSEKTKNKFSILRKQQLENNSHIKWFIVNNGEKDIKVQGKWEKDVANWLNKQNIKWDRKTLKYSNHRRYTPDFYLKDYDWYLEVKGWLRDIDIIKMSKVIEEHHIVIKMLNKKEYKQLDNITILDLVDFVQMVE